MFEIHGKSEGCCPLCRGSKEKKLFIVKSPGYNGEICGDHLHVLVPEKAAEKNGIALAVPVGH